MGPTLSGLQKSEVSLPMTRRNEVTDWNRLVLDFPRHLDGLSNVYTLHIINPRTFSIIRYPVQKSDTDISFLFVWSVLIK